MKDEKKLSENINETEQTLSTNTVKFCISFETMYCIYLKTKFIYTSDYFSIKLNKL